MVEYTDFHMNVPPVRLRLRQWQSLNPCSPAKMSRAAATLCTPAIKCSALARALRAQEVGLLAMARPAGSAGPPVTEGGAALQRG